MCICAAPKTPIEGVTIYGRHDARDFREVRTFFEDRGVVFTHADVGQDPANLERMVVLSRQQEAVVVEIGQKIFVGFQPDALEAILP